MGMYGNKCLTESNVEALNETVFDVYNIKNKDLENPKELKDKIKKIYNNADNPSKKNAIVNTLFAFIISALSFGGGLLIAMVGIVPGEIAGIIMLIVYYGAALSADPGIYINKKIKKIDKAIDKNNDYIEKHKDDKEKIKELKARNEILKMSAADLQKCLDKLLKISQNVTKDGRKYIDWKKFVDTIFMSYI